MYRYTTDGRPVDHADHAWEEWHGYLSSDLPEWATADDAGLCCHTCHLIIVERF